MSLSPYDVLAPYQKLYKTRQMDRWAELQAAPPLQTAATLIPPPAAEPDDAPEADAAAVPAAQTDDAPQAEALQETPSVSVPPMPPAPRPQRAIYAQIIRKHTEAAAHSHFTPAIPRP